VGDALLNHVIITYLKNSVIFKIREKRPEHSIPVDVIELFNVV
jgi:hypothetical protein